MCVQCVVLAGRVWGVDCARLLTDTYRVPVGKTLLQRICCVRDAFTHGPSCQNTHVYCMCIVQRLVSTFREGRVRILSWETPEHVSDTPPFLPSHPHTHAMHASYRTGRVKDTHTCAPPCKTHTQYIRRGPYRESGATGQAHLPPLSCVASRHPGDPTASAPLQQRERQHPSWNGPLPVQSL